MIPRDYITQWRERAPWSEDFQVEQDLIISRALVEMFVDPRQGRRWRAEEAARAVSERLISLLPGEPWKGERDG